MEPQLPGLLATPDRMIDLAPPHIIADMHRLRDAFHEAVEPDALLLIGWRHVRSNNRWRHNLHPPTQGRGPSTMLGQRQDASTPALAGSEVSGVETWRGTLKRAVEVT